MVSQSGRDRSSHRARAYRRRGGHLGACRPPVLTVTVRDSAGRVIASGSDLGATDDTPIARLTRHGDRVERVDIWPNQQAIGQLVLLPGGEVGTLKQWWHADDYSEWRWQIELYNHR